MKVIIVCEFSGIVREEFRKQGHDAWSCDVLPTEIESPYHYQHDIRDLDLSLFDLMIAHPPCTYITNVGVRHLFEHIKSKNGNKAKIHGEERRKLMVEACEFFNYLKNAPVPHICIENPIPHKYAKRLIGNYTQLIQPWWFGHLESKATCLWLKNLPLLIPTNNVKKEMLLLPKNQRHRVHYASPGPNRWKEHSRTYTGIAQAMASQWGNL